MATYYYNNATADGNLGNNGNWWLDALHTNVASLPPDSTIDCVIEADASSNTDIGSGAAGAKTLTLTGGTFSAPIHVANAVVVQTAATILNADIAVLVSGPAMFTMNGASTVSGSTIDINGGPLISNGAFANQVGDGNSFVGSGQGIQYAANYVDCFPDYGTSTPTAGTLLTGTVTFSGVDNTANPQWGATANQGTWNFVNRNNSGNFYCDQFNITGGNNSGGINANVATFTNCNNSGAIIAPTVVFNEAGNNGGTVNASIRTTFNGGANPFYANWNGTVYGPVTFAGNDFNDIGVFGTLADNNVMLSSNFRFTCPSANTLNIDASLWTVEVGAEFVFEANSGNSGILPNARFLSILVSNRTGTVTGNLTVPGTQSGTTIAVGLDQGSLGNFGTLVVSGVAPGSGGGPLGGPSIEL